MGPIRRNVPSRNPFIARFQANALLLTLAFGAPLRADTLLRIPNLATGSSTSPGYGEWIDLDQIQFSVDNPLGESGEKGGTADINIGIGEIGQLHLSKPTGALSADLFRHAIIGNSVGTAQIRVVDVRPDGVFPTAAWKLDRAFVASYSMESSGGVLVDEFSLVFNKIAFAVVIDGQVSAYGWDNTRQTAWTDHGLEIDLLREMNAAPSAFPGDFIADGRVDGNDLLVWQRRQSSGAESALDLAAWQGHFGEVLAISAAASATVPEPAGWPALLIGLTILPGLSRRAVARYGTGDPERAMKPFI